MNQLAKALAILFTITLIAPSVLLVQPQPVYAQVPGLEVPVGDGITRLKETLNLITSYTNTAANVAMQINAYVLQPLAFVLSGNLMKALTAGVVGFVIGKANGTGIPQFVTDVQKSLQTVGDAKALAFFDQFGRNSNSPFAGSIVSNLRKDYLSKTSLAGFWAANMNTLARSTPSYRPGFLAGNWQQGGIAAWFALTTQTQNNPYTLSQNAQSTLGTLIGPGAGGATGARMAELNWGKGFLSWCGASAGSTTADNDGTEMDTEGVNPGDPCTKDGVPGTIKTPGSVIVDTLNKVLGGQQDIITRMGNVGHEINGILSNIGTVMKTVNFAVDILGNSSLGSATGGLLGSDSPSSANSSSRLLQYQTAPGSLGVTNSTVYKSAGTLTISGTDMLNRVNQYESSWNTISAAAQAASTTAASLTSFCIAQQKLAPSVFASSGNPEGDLAAFMTASNAQAAAAKTAITTQIAPVLGRFANATAISAAARAMVAKIQSEANSGTETNAYLADLQTLQTFPPTDNDLSNALQDALVANMAIAVPTGSLTVTGGSLLSQMSTIGTNADALKASVCTPTASAAASASGGDFGGV